VPGSVDQAGRFPPVFTGSIGAAPAGRGLSKTINAKNMMIITMLLTITAKVKLSIIQTVLRLSSSKVKV
jgi:hypothetical protein